MKKQINPLKSLDIKAIDFIPALSGLIGKTALITSFAVVWAKELGISTTDFDFVFENVRIEMVIAGFITLITALLFKNVSPSGTLAPMVVLIPAMVQFGVHPFILSILVGIVGILCIKLKLFHKLLSLSGMVSKTSLTFTFGVTGVILSLRNINIFFKDNSTPLLIILASLFIIYIILNHVKKNWLIIPFASVISIGVSLIFKYNIELTFANKMPHFNPSYWWNEVWGIGFGLDMPTILKTLPFAFFVVILWAIDTVSITTMIDTNYQEGEEREEIDLERSFIITSIRNMIGGINGGAQTAALWRSFLIPLYMVKRPLRSASIILAIMGIISGIIAVPIKVLSFSPLIWSVLLFGIYMPFVSVGLRNLKLPENCKHLPAIIIFLFIGIYYNAIFTWIAALIYEKLYKMIKLKVKS